MKTLKYFFRDLYLDEKGAVAVEYALLISCIATAIAASVLTFRDAVLKCYMDALVIFSQ